MRERMREYERGKGGGERKREKSDKIQKNRFKFL
jgi:hypothetical protein